MRRILLLLKLSFLFLTVINQQMPCYAQREFNPLPYVAKEPPYDTAPQFPGGLNALYKFIDDSLRYPGPEKEKHIKGNVYLTFTVSKKGKIENVRIINGVPGGPNLAAEARRLVESMPRWTPAVKKGKKVDAEYTLTIPFGKKMQRRIKNPDSR